MFFLAKEIYLSRKIIEIRSKQIIYETEIYLVKLQKNFRSIIYQKI